MARRKRDDDGQDIVCSFCGRGIEEAVVIPGPNNVCICDDCARQVISIADEARRQSGLPRAGEEGRNAPGTLE